MRNKTLTTLALAAALTMGAGCTDITMPPKSTATEANIFNEPGSYKQFLAKLYAGLSVTGQQGPAGGPDIQGIDEGFSQYVRLLWQMQELPTEEAVIAWGDDGVQELNTQKWGSSNQFLGSMYYRVFFQVTLANEFLRQTTDEKLTSRGVGDALRAEIHGYRAEARFLRALSYWHGIDLFGDIPLVTEADPLGSTPPKQSTRAEVYRYVVSELNAIKPELPAPGAQEYGRADQGAVAMLLANVYLNAQVYVGEDHYADARAAVESVVATGKYHLDPSYRHLFLADNHTSSELIFTVPQDGLKQQSYGGTTFLMHAEIGGSMNASVYGVDGGWYGLRTRPEGYAMFPGGAGGPDKRGYFFYTDGQSLDISNLTNFNDGIGAPKYQNVTSTGAPASNAGNSDIDFPMFRLGEAYLIYAEAVLRGGGGSRAQALDYVNQLRARAYGNASGNVTDAQLTLPFLLAERGRELFWEAHRRTDLIRYGQFTSQGVWQWKGGVKAGKVTESFRNLYPLPASELLANPNLKQNAGY
jgi:hypothetical protein